MPGKRHTAAYPQSIPAPNRINFIVANLANTLNQEYGLEEPWKLFGLDGKVEFEGMLKVSEEPSE
jgi:hypothetical protein